MQFTLFFNYIYGNDIVLRFIFLYLKCFCSIKNVCKSYSQKNMIEANNKLLEKKTPNMKRTNKIREKCKLPYQVCTASDTL